MLIFTNAGPLFGIAKAAYQQTKAASSDSEDGQMQALVAVVFSAAALEAFINEAVELASLPQFLGSSEEPPAVAAFRSLLTEAEDQKAELGRKFMQARIAFTGQGYDAGRSPYQDLALLVDVRNALLHSKKSPETFEQRADGGIIFKPGPIIARLRSKNIVAKHEPSDTMASWVHTISTPAVARWACNAAAAMVASVIEVAPRSQFRQLLELFYAQPFTAEG
jgi:hypothetical protein